MRHRCRSARWPRCSHATRTMRKFSLDFIWAKVQPDVDRNANAKRSGFPIPNLLGGTRLSVPHRSLRRRSSQWNSRGRTLSLRGSTLWSLQPYIGRWLRNTTALPACAGHPNPASSTRAWKQEHGACRRTRASGCERSADRQIALVASRARIAAGRECADKCDCTV